MALFEKKQGKKRYFSAASIVTEGTTNIGKIIGNDSIHIDGHVIGDVKVNNVVIIGRNGVVDGNIKARQIISSGTTQGDILCDSLELLETSKSKGDIKANKALIKGKSHGNIVCSGLFISQHGRVESTIQAKNVHVAGSIVGMIACKMLKIFPSSSIKGKMFADRIINQGGHIEGFIGKYSELLVDNPQLGGYASIFNAQKEIPLLQKSDIYVDVEEEIQNGKDSPSSMEDEEFYIDAEIENIDESKLFPVE